MPSRSEWWRRHWRAVVGGVLLGLSIGSTIVLAWRGASKPMDGALAALLALLAAGFQGGAAWVFAGQGRADPVHAASAFRHLYRLALRAAEATKIADRANRKSSEQADLRDAMTKLSVHLSWLEEGLIDAGEHWAQVHPQLRDGPVEDQMGSGQE